MTLKEARRLAIEKAKEKRNKGKNVYIYRTAPRQFEVSVGKKTPVQIIYSEWAKEGWYQEAYPEYFK